MSKLYEDQTSLRIRLTTSVDITGATCKVKYKKPGGTTGSWTGTIESTSLGIFYYDLTALTPLDEAGDWTFWAYVTFSDLRVAAGKPFIVTVYAEGE
jgi:hypothetical protein